MDYVYQAMGCRISLLQESSQEAQYILRYINTSNYSYGESHAMFTTFSDISIHLNKYMVSCILCLVHSQIHLTILMMSFILCSVHFQIRQYI